VTFAGGASRVDLTLGAGESRILDFSVNVPADATPGDHAGGIVVSALTDSGQVKLDRRIATRLYLRVKGELQALMTIGSIDATYDPSWNPFDGTVNLAFTLTNNGNVSLGADTVSRVTGLFGIPFSADNRVEIPELLPGTSRTVTLPISGVGQWLFLTTSVDLVGTIDEDAINPGPMPTAKRDALLFATPWFAIVLLIGSVLLFFALRSKRRRDAQRAQEWLEFAAAAAEEEAEKAKTQASKKRAATKPTAKKQAATSAATKRAPKQPGN
jgi:dihydroorotate dehydrogenase (fumarate)